MKKELFIIVLSILMSVLSMPASVKVEYDNLTFRIISVWEAEVIYSEKNKEIENIIIPSSIPYLGRSRTVTQIGDGAFSNCKELVSVTLPETIKIIGYSAFKNCTSLKGIELPQNVETIQSSAFKGCSSLTSIKLPPKVRTIKDSTFEDCTSLSHIDILHIRYIFYWAFKNCTSLVSLILPNDISIVHSDDNGWAFEGCTNVKKVASQYYFNSNPFPSNPLIVKYDNNYFIDSIIKDGWIYGCDRSNRIMKSIYFAPLDFIGDYEVPLGIESIGEGAFAFCGNLTSITIPQSVTSIGSKAFLDCTELKSIYYDSHSPTECAEDAFTPDLYENATLYVPIGTRGIFENTKSWREFKKIVEYPFPGIQAETIILSHDYVDLTIDESIELNATVLPEETADKTITWTSSNEDIAIVDSIGTVRAIDVGQATITATCGSASSSCIINVKPILAQHIDIDPEEWIGEEGELFFINAVVRPTNATNKTLKWESTDEDIATVDSQGIVSVHKPGYCVITVSTVDGSDLKAECHILSKPKGREITYTYHDQTIVYIVLDENTKTCRTREGTDSSNHCGNHVSGDLILPEKVFDGYAYYTLTSIGENSFHGCGDLTSVELPNTVTIIGSGAFFDCSKLREINIPTSVKEIGGSAFALCESLNKIELPESVAYIGSQAFKVCRSLTAFRIPSSITEIESGTFYLCTGLRHITIPSSVTKIHYGAFQQCTALESVVFEGDMIDMIEQTAFAFCNKLSKVVFPFYLNCIDTSVFRDCSISNIWLNFVSEWSDIDGYGEIHMDAFKGNPISNIYSCSPIPAKLASTAFDNFSADLYVLDEYKESYLNSIYKWKDFTNTYSLVLPESISIVHMEGALDHVKQGDQIQLSAVFNPDDTSFKSVYWESSNPEIATVDQNGLVTVIGSSYSDNGCQITAYSLCSLWKASVTIDSVDLDRVDELEYGGDSNEVVVYDFNGRKIGNCTSGLPSGFYIVKHGKQTTKLVIH